MDQRGPRNHPPLNQQQQNWLQQQSRGQGSMVNQRDQGPSQGQESGQADDAKSKAETPKKGTPFIPLQVMKINFMLSF
jgi:hypothetical protein